MEAEVCPDYIQLVEIPPKMSVSRFVGYLKRKSSLTLFERHANFNTSMETEVFGVGDSMLIQLEKIQKRLQSIYKIDSKKTI